jgi:eukaryotic-like serine/threonine-protein kinase
LDANTGAFAMNITDSLILSPDVEWIAIEVLPPEIQKRLAWQPGDYALTRPRKRTLPKLVNAKAVALVEEFRSETTIVDAILRYCNKHQVDPKTTLYEAFPVLQQLIQAQLLVPPQEVGKLMPAYEPGNWVAGAKVLDCIQVMEDSELYCVLWNGRKAALKIACGTHAKMMLQREAEILKRLDGEFAPALIATGIEERDYPYLLIEWLEGVPIDEAAEQLRNSGRSTILKLCVALLRVYERLHDQKLIHGDVHPRNIFICGEEIKLIDFGLSWQSDDLAAAVGGVHFYFAPERAELLRTTKKLPISTAFSEQYALAVLIYQLIVGQHYIDFQVEQFELLQQIVEAQTLPFAYWGLSPWHEVETPLQKALSKAPSNRFPTIGAFADALGGSLESGMPLLLVPAVSIQNHLKAFLESTQIDGSLLSAPWPQSTTWSVFDGAPGIAYALYRIACLRSDPALLATADLWATRAHQHRPITNKQTARFSSGELHCVRAMIAHACGNGILVNEAICDFLNDVTLPQSSFTLLPGIAGTLHVCTLLLETVEVRQDLLDKGNSLLDALWQYPVTTFTTKFLGMAHGWSGILYATIRWCRVAQSPLPNKMQKYLEELCTFAESSKKGQRWSWRRDKKGYLPGWCNGNAGLYYLWLQASYLQIDDKYIIFSEQSARQCWESPSHIPNLCCGIVGQIYVLLNFYQHTGEIQWQKRALQLAKKVVIDQQHENTILYQGNVGIALIAAELDFPELASMPFFAGEVNTLR